MRHTTLDIPARAAIALVAGLLASQTVLAQGLPEITIEQPPNGIDVATLGIPLTDIPLTVSYRSSTGVDKIEVLVDGSVQFVDQFSTPEREGRRAYLWDATAHGPGEHTISVIAFAGSRSAGAQTVVTYGAVPSVGEGQPKPSLSIVSPGPGAVVSGLISLRAEPKGARPHWVQFFLDGRAVGHSLGEPYAVSIDTSLYDDGRHVVYAAMKTDRGTVTSETLHVNFVNLDIPEPQGEAVTEPPVQGPEVEPAGVPTVADAGPLVALPAEPLEVIVPPVPPPTDPISVGAISRGEPELAVVEPQLPQLPTAPPADVAPIEPATVPDLPSIPSLPVELADAEAWQPLGGVYEQPSPAVEETTGEQPAVPVPSQPGGLVEPLPAEEPTPPEPSIRPLDMELADPEPGEVEWASHALHGTPPSLAGPVVESEQKPAEALATEPPPTAPELAGPEPLLVLGPLDTGAEPGSTTLDAMPTEPALPPAVATEGPPEAPITVPSPLTPELVEIEQLEPRDGLPLPLLTPLPVLTGPAEAAAPPLLPVAVGAPARAAEPMTPAEPQEPEPATGHTASEESARPVEVPTATAASLGGPLITTGHDPVPVQGHAPLLAGPTGGPAPEAPPARATASLDGTPLRVTHPMLVEDDIVFVPLRDVVLALGGSAMWDATAGRLSGRIGTASFSVSAGTSTARLRNEDRSLEAPARVYEGALVVPLSFAEEVLGLGAAYDTATGILELRSASR